MPMHFLFQSPHGWHDLFQRPHHLATQFCENGHTVRWVEPRYASWWFKDPGRFRQSVNATPSDRLSVCSVTLLNGERFGWVRNRNKRNLAAAFVREEPRSKNSGGSESARILWLYNPHEVHLADSVPHDVLVYDIMDEYRGFPWSPPNIEAEETRLLEKAEYIFAGTHALYEAKRKIAGDKVHCILSGVDVEHFEEREESRVPADLQPCKSRHEKLLGYAGMIDLRIDQQLLAEAARKNPDIGFILIGDARTDVSILAERPNIYLLGKKRYDELPAYYHAWDGALLPFVENELTRHINPTKILEYAAAGLPIVARALPDVERYYADGAFLYRTSTEFIDAIVNITPREESPSPICQQKLETARAWLDERSWTKIADRMLEIVSK